MARRSRTENYGNWLLVGRESIKAQINKFTNFLQNIAPVIAWNSVVKE